MYDEILIDVLFELGNNFDLLPAEDLSYLQSSIARVVKTEIAKNDFLFLTEYAELEKLDEPAPNNWTNSYELPDDYLKKVVISNAKFTGMHNYPESVGSNDYHIVIGDRRIYTKGIFNGKIYMLYIKNKPITEWTEAFKDFIKYKFASKIAFAYTNNQTMVTLMENRSQQAWDICVNEDIREQGDGNLQLGNFATRNVALYE